MIAAIALAAGLMAGGGHVDPRMPARCAAGEVEITLPISYDVPAWDDEIGAQVGIWSQAGVIVGYSYQEDGVVYRTAQLADRCPVYVTHD